MTPTLIPIIPPSLIGHVAQAVTSVAHVQNHDPEVRFATERLAGEWLAAA